MCTESTDFLFSLDTAAILTVKFLNIGTDRSEQTV